jgi:integrase
MGIVTAFDPTSARLRLYRIRSTITRSGKHRNQICEETGVSTEAIGVCVHSMRATAATNALSNEADIAKVQEWLGHANVSTTRLYDRRKTRPEGSPTFHVKYSGVLVVTRAPDIIRRANGFETYC